MGGECNGSKIVRGVRVKLSTLASSGSLEASVFGAPLHICLLQKKMEVNIPWFITILSAVFNICFHEGKITTYKDLAFSIMILNDYYIKLLWYWYFK